MDSDRTWTATWRDLGCVGDAGPVLETLKASYAEAHRAYHTWAHIEDCLAKLTLVEPLVQDLAAVRLALFFHDAVYDTQRADNEVRSAERMDEACEALGVHGSSRETARRWIHATADHALADANDTDGLVMLDLDMSILAADSPTFQQYERDIRREYAWVPEEVFCARRGALVAGWLARPAIFGHAVLRAKWDAAGRRNLVASLEGLRGRAHPRNHD